MKAQHCNTKMWFVSVNVPLPSCVSWQFYLSKAKWFWLCRCQCIVWQLYFQRTALSQWKMCPRVSLDSLLVLKPPVCRDAEQVRLCSLLHVSFIKVSRASVSSAVYSTWWCCWISVCKLSWSEVLKNDLLLVNMCVSYHVCDTNIWDVQCGNSVKSEGWTRLRK